MTFHDQIYLNTGPRELLYYTCAFFSQFLEADLQDLMQTRHLLAGKPIF